MTLVDALAAALHERYEPIEGGSTGILYDEKYGYNGRCRACGEDGVWSKSIDAAAILADPTFREALTHALGEAMTWVEDDKMDAHPECMTDECDHEDGCPDWGALGCGDAAAIIAYLLPAAATTADTAPTPEHDAPHG